MKLKVNLTTNVTKECFKDISSIVINAEENNVIVYYEDMTGQSFVKEFIKEMILTND